MASGAVRPLVRLYAWGLAGVVLPLLLLVAGLAAAQFAAERAARLELIARDLVDLRLTVDALLEPADVHVRQLRRLAEDHLAGRLATPAAPLRALLRPASWTTGGLRSEALLLDGVAGTPAERLVGNLHGRAGLLERRGGDPLEVDMALGLFEPMRLAHLASPHLRRSYYFSARGDFLVVYPFASGRASARELGSRSFDDYLAAMYALYIYRLAPPSQNPGRHGSYWTPAHFDAGAGGWTVGHAAPVRVDGVFAGVVATDILLRFLDTALARHHRPPGRVW
ncbi:MAG TPA: hypothetical protein VFY87_11725, partial [Geminicoccaceae bacterium]|nr:hypothetical protein [Geminicoccaceae bacterium]